MTKTLLTIIALVGAILLPASADAQTFRVAGGVSANGTRTYREVYEYDYVTEKPCFPGGRPMLVKHINENREYPQKAYKEGIQGMVTCSFVVNADGSVSHIQVLKGVEPSLNKEAVRVLALMPTWTPGKLDGKPVPVRVIYSVAFRH